MKKIFILIFLSAIVFSTSTTLIWAQGWVQKTDMPGVGRFWNAVFRINNIIYTGTGKTGFGGAVTQDIWAYNTQTDTWEQVANYPVSKEGCDGFGNGQRGFIAFGTTFLNFTKTVYEYLPTSNTWVQKADVPGGVGFSYSHGFTIENKYYIGPENGTQKVYAYDLVLNTWAEVAPFPGADRRAQVAFSANGKGYLGLGASVFGGGRSDFFKYDPVADAWTPIASMDRASDQSCGTSINNVGYVFNVGGNLKLTYRYDEAADDWIQVSNFAGDRIANSTFIGFENSAYLVLGERTISGGNIPSKQIWKFTPVPVANKVKLAKEIQLSIVNKAYLRVKGYNLGQASTQIKIVALNGKLEKQIEIPANKTDEFLCQMPKTSSVHLVTLIIDGQRVKTEKLYF